VEAVAAIIAIFLLLTGAVGAVFMVGFQPIWGIVDVAVSKEHSGGTKAAVILLTLLLLGPIMTFFYACFGTKSAALKKTSIIAAFVVMVSASGFFILAAAYPTARSNVSRFLDRDVVSDDTSVIGTVPGDQIDIAPFTAVHYVPTDNGRWSVAISDFDIHGPIADSAQPINVPSIYPLNQIAIDSEGHRVYGATTHLVGKIVPNTGNFVELEIDPALPRLSWPSGIAFDSHNRRLIVTGRSGTYFHDPETGEWEHAPKFGGLDLLTMTYDEDNRVFYGLVSGFGKDVVDTIVEINSDGAVLSTIELSEGIPSESLPAGRAQLIKTSRDLVILVSAYRSARGSEDGVAESRMYMVDPDTGDIGLVSSVSSN
jgi:hypothetical protein